MKHKGLFITLLVVGLVVVVPVATIYGCFYDTTSVSYQGGETIDADALMHKKLVHSFDTAAVESKLTFSFSQDEMNQCLYQARDSLSDSAKSTLTGAEVILTGKDQATIAFDISHPIFRTHVEIYSTIEDVVDETNPTQGYYLFKVTDAKVGRVSGLANLASSIASNVISDEDLEAVLASSGLTMDVDLKNKEIRYTKANLLKDIAESETNSDSSASARSSDDSSDFATAFFATALENNLLSFDLSNEAKAEASFDLSKLKENKDYTDSSRYTLISTSSLNNDLKVLLDKGIIPNDDTHPSYVMDYLLLGYTGIEEEERVYIDTLDLSSIGISNNKTYPGTYPYPEREISSILANQFLVPKVGEVARLTEEDFGYAILQSGVFGVNYLFINEDRENDYCVNSLVIDNCYCDITSEDLSLVIGMNINGCETNLIMDTKPVNDPIMQSMKIALKVDNLYFGTLTVEQELKDYLYSVISSSLTGSDWLTFDAKTETFTFDLAPSYNKSVLSSLISTDHLSASFVGDSRAEDGYISFSITSL